MADTKLKANGSGSTDRAASAAEEEEVYSTLGALLGMLEVVASDDVAPLAEAQVERLEVASRLGRRLQHQLEALLILAGEDLGARLKCQRARLGPVVEHAMRGAQRACNAEDVTLSLLARASWGDLPVRIDPSRVDRALAALFEALAGSVGHGGTIEVHAARRGQSVELALVGQRAAAAVADGGRCYGDEPSTLASGLLVRACRRLFALHEGELTLDLDAPSVRLSLPLAEPA